ncbi:MAG: DUF2202 domain-containing protein [Candidatus Nanopelagicales bacterium]|jgi:hypothetical protein|nr:DUF2202 domain-containing protein [Candidatus Nanopelagicales bacterium]
MKRLLLPAAILFASAVGSPLLAVEPLPIEVAGALGYMREEEKLARDVYLHFAALYPVVEPGSNIFAKIAKSEQRHTDAVLKLLDKYGVDDPVVSDDGVVNPPGIFTNTDLQTLYDQLVANGEAGLAEALAVGVLIEHTDIGDIGDAIELSEDYADIVRVYSNLLSGSYSHLSAFEEVLEKLEADDDADAAEVTASSRAPAAKRPTRTR